MSIQEVTVRVPINIALVKYWGKRNEELMLPTNDSLSLTVDELWAETTVRRRPSTASADRVILNGQEIDISRKTRYVRCFNFSSSHFLHCLKTHMKPGEFGCKPPEIDPPSATLRHVCCCCFICHLHAIQIDSRCSFPVAAGLASSAAGFGAIAFGLGQLLGLPEEAVARIARLGSGSACRSVLSQGGLAWWRAGSRADGEDCHVTGLTSPAHWPTLRCVILVLAAHEKETGSSDGMRRTVATSELLEFRCRVVVPKRVQRLVEAWNAKDFTSLSREVCADSNQMHAVCLDSRPPLLYMTADSWRLVAEIERFNALTAPSARAAYTFDAGPNCCVFIEERDVDALLQFLGESCNLPEERGLAALSRPRNPNSGGVSAKESTGVAKIPVLAVVVSTVGGAPSRVQWRLGNSEA